MLGSVSYCRCRAVAAVEILVRRARVQGSIQSPSPSSSTSRCRSGEELAKDDAVENTVVRATQRSRVPQERFVERLRQTTIAGSPFLAYREGVERTACDGLFPVAVGATPDAIGSEMRDDVTRQRDARVIERSGCRNRLL
jgi:hypothetical protein